MVDAIVPHGLSDADVKSYVQMKRPDLLGAPASGIKTPAQNIPVQSQEPASSNFLQQVQQRMGQNIATPLDALRKTGNAIFDSASPERQEVMQGLQHPFSAQQGLTSAAQASPPAQLYQMAKGWKDNMPAAVGDILTGVAMHQASGGGVPEDRTYAPGSPSANAPSPAVMSVLARHVPVLGRVLRGIDDIQTLLGKDAPHPTSATNVAPPKPPVPETAGVQWGTGGQGPLELRGKMIPPSAPPPEVVRLPVSKTPQPDPENTELFRGKAQDVKGGASEMQIKHLQEQLDIASPDDRLGILKQLRDAQDRAAGVSIQQPQEVPDISKMGRKAAMDAAEKATPTQPPFPGPKTYEVTRGTDPFTHPNAPANWESTHDYSSNVEQYGYHPDSSTISVKYPKGAVYQFKATPQMYENMKSAPSVGGYIHDVLEPAQRSGKGTYIGTVATRGQRVSQALGGQQ